MKLYKIFEIGYLLIAVFCIVQAVLKFISKEGNALAFLIFAILAVFMYFFKRWFRINRFEKRK